MRKLYLALALVLASVSSADAQNPGDVASYSASPPPPPTQVGASYAGNRGNGTYYYWVAARYPAGTSGVAGPAIVRGAQVPSGSAVVTVAWTAMDGATAYDVIRTTSARFPSTGSCTGCVVAAATTSTFATDNGGALGDFTPAAGAGAVNVGLRVNNRDYVSPRLEFLINGAVAAAINSSGVVGAITGNLEDLSTACPDGALFQAQSGEADCPAGNTLTLDLSGFTANRNWAVPDADGTVVGETNTQTLTNKAIDGQSNTIQARQAADCTAETGGVIGELCVDSDDGAIFSCVPTAGDCDQASEWRAQAGGGLTSWTYWYPTAAGSNSNNLNTIGPYVGGGPGIDPGFYLNSQIGSIQWSSGGQTYHFQHRLSPNFNGSELTFTLTGANANSGVVNNLSVAGRCYSVGDDLDTPTVNQFTATVDVSIDLSAGGNTLESGSINTWSSMPCVAGDLLVLAVTRPATANIMTTPYFAITEGW